MDRRVRFERGVSWMEVHGRIAFLSIDFVIGAASAGAMLAAAVRNPQFANEAKTTIFVTGVASGIALMALTASLFGNFQTLIEGRYRWVIKRTKGGVEAALFPYKVIGVVSASLALASFLALIVWNLPSPSFFPISSIGLRAAAVALTTGLAAWALVGTAQLTALNIFHASQRNRMEEAIDETNEARRQKISKVSSE
jgi:hypothetical protein